MIWPVRLLTTYRSESAEMNRMNMTTLGDIQDRPRLSRYVALAATLTGLIWIGWQLLTNPGFEWAVVGQWLFSPGILAGVAMTLWLTALVMVLGTVVGIIVALMRMSDWALLSALGHGYVWFFRGVPALVQLVFWYNLAALFPEVSLGIPFGGPKLVEIPANDAITSFTAAMLGLGLIEAAYMAEIVRGGLLSVDKGQVEASRALGYSPAQTFFRVVLPQAMTAIIPAAGNQVIGALKFTSLAATVALYELMHSVEVIYARTFQTIPMLIVAAIWYLIMVTVLSVLQVWVERHFSRGQSNGASQQ